jgi:hypothetical protein
MPDGCAIGHHGVQSQHPQQSVGQQSSVNFQVANSPSQRGSCQRMPTGQGVGACLVLLKVLGGQKHAFVPLNALWYRWKKMSHAGHSVF